MFAWLVSICRSFRKAETNRWKHNTPKQIPIITLCRFNCEFDDRRSYNFCLILTKYKQQSKYDFPRIDIRITLWKWIRTVNCASHCPTKMEYRNVTYDAFVSVLEHSLNEKSRKNRINWCCGKLKGFRWAHSTNKRHLLCTISKNIE